MKCSLMFFLQAIAAQQVEESGQGALHILRCFTPCSSGLTGNEVIPGTQCVYYHECWDGEVRARKGCGSPLVFNEERDYCDFPSEVNCLNGDYECPGSVSPTRVPTPEPTRQPTPQPTMWPTRAPTTMRPVEPIVIVLPPPEPEPITATKPPTVETKPPTERPTMMPTTVQAPPMKPIQPLTGPPTIKATPETPNNGGNAMSHIESKRNLIEKYVLISYDGQARLSYPSKRYTYGRFMQSLQTMAVDGFGADFKFNLWEGNANEYYYGLVNLAAFLANCMVESIETDSCDELNWQEVSGRYAMSNACGQESRSYQDETCDIANDIFSCEVVPDMKVTAVSSATESRAPPPLTCKPGSGQGYHSGYWDSASGRPIGNTPYSNDIGRTDTEGCCFWGRGALLTRGVCNIGKLNYFIGKRGADLGRTTLYPIVDFCQDPEATCASGYTEELHWTVAMFEWSERIQRYAKNGWGYEKELEKFVDNGMSDDSFIESVSRILSWGCHAPGCSDNEVRMLDRRRSNFYLIINDIFDVKTLQWLAKYPVDPTRQPTGRPTQRPTMASSAKATREPSPRPTRASEKPAVENILLPGDSPTQQVTMPTTPNPAQFDENNYIPSETSSANGDLNTDPPTSNTKEDNSIIAPESGLIGLEGNGAPSEAHISGKKQVLISLAVVALVY